MPDNESDNTITIGRVIRRQPGTDGAAWIVRFSKSVERSAARLRLPGLMVLLAVFVPFTLAFFKYSSTFSIAHAQSLCGDQPILDARWSYTAESAHDYLSACGADGRAAIALEQVGDLFFPVLYATVLTVAFALLLSAVAPVPKVLRPLVLLPLLTAAVDYIENIGIWIQLAVFPSRGAFVRFFSVVTDLKIGLAYACLAVLVVLMVRATVVHLQRQRSPQARPAT